MLLDWEHAQNRKGLEGAIQGRINRAKEHAALQACRPIAKQKGIELGAEVSSGTLRRARKLPGGAIHKQAKWPN